MSILFALVPRTSSGRCRGRTKRTRIPPKLQNVWVKPEFRMSLTYWWVFVHYLVPAKSLIKRRCHGVSNLCSTWSPPTDVTTVRDASGLSPILFSPNCHSGTVIPQQSDGGCLSHLGASLLHFLRNQWHVFDSCVEAQWALLLSTCSSQLAVSVGRGVWWTTRSSTWEMHKCTMYPQMYIGVRFWKSGQIFEIWPGGYICEPPPPPKYQIHLPHRECFFEKIEFDSNIPLQRECHKKNCGSSARSTMPLVFRPILIYDCTVLLFLCRVLLSWIRTILEYSELGLQGYCSTLASTTLQPSPESGLQNK